jgi:hypothetical protein
MALLPLRNALSFLDSAPAAMQLREYPGNPNTPVWDVDTQYFKNDCVVSPTTGGMFIFAGMNDPHKTTIRGGVDPWEDSFIDANWVSFAPAGLNDVTTGSVQITAPTVNTAATPVVVTGGSFGLGPDLATPTATYLVTWQGQWATTGNVAFAATDQYIWAFTPNGTGAQPVSATSAPGAVQSPYYFSGSVVVNLPADGTQILGSLTSGPTNNLGVVPILSNLRVTYARIL